MRQDRIGGWKTETWNLDSALIRLPTQHNPLTFHWDDQLFEIRSMLLSEINDGRGLSLLLDIGETMDIVPRHGAHLHVPQFPAKRRPDGRAIARAYRSPRR